MSKIALVYPGQGSQEFKMGSDFYEKYPEYKNVIDLAFSKNEKLKSILFEEEGDAINDTFYAQLAIFSSQAGIMKVLENNYEMKFDGVAGFSLGEYSAFLTANKFSYEDGLKIIEKRGIQMQKNNGCGTMYAAIGLTYDELAQALNDLEVKTITIANYNLEKQLVLAGSKEEFVEIEEKLKECGVKRLIELNVSGAFHTNLYDQVGSEFASNISEFTYSNIDCEVYSNLTANKVEKDIDFPTHCYNHMINGVKWYDQIQKMIADGYDTFIEIGCKSVVSAMIKKINKDVKIYTITDIESLKVMEELWRKK